MKRMLYLTKEKTLLFELSVCGRMESVMGNVMERKRDYNMDMIKAIAITLVVIGHIVQYICVPEGFWENHVFRYIYSFHMPLFMFISGYFSYCPQKEIDAEWLKQRFVRLMLPFLAWILPMYLYNRVYSYQSFGRFCLGLLRSPDTGGLWFFEVLFLNSICLFLAEKLRKILCGKWQKYSDICFSTVSKGIVYVVVNVVSLAGFPYLGLALCSWHLFFYFGGCLLRELQTMSVWSSNEMVAARTAWKWISILGFPVLGFFWRQYEAPVWMKLFGVIGRFGYRFFVPILGIGFVWNLVFYINDSVKSQYSILGQYTGEIYILQFLFIRQYTHHVVMDVILSFGIGLFVSFAIARMMDSPKVPRVIPLVFFGKK